MSLVLIIDDDPAMRAMMRQALAMVGHEAVEAANGVAGLAEFQKRTPDLVISDIFMPDKEGIQTVREIRNLDPSVKIIAISGGGRIKDMSFLELAREFGADAVLNKPFRAREFLDTVARLLGAPPG